MWYMIIYTPENIIYHEALAEWYMIFKGVYIHVPHKYPWYIYFVIYQNKTNFVNNSYDIVPLLSQSRVSFRDRMTDGFGWRFATKSLVEFNGMSRLFLLIVDCHITPQFFLDFSFVMYPELLFRFHFDCSF